MISNEDIKQKRYNISKLFELLNDENIINKYNNLSIKNSNNNIENIHNTVNENNRIFEKHNDLIENIIENCSIDIKNYFNLISVFKYSYHGISNKKLFTNIMKFSKKY